MNDPHPVVIFDGHCQLCNGAVDFIIRRDPAARFRFVPSQSEAGKALLARHHLTEQSSETVVLICGDRALLRSDAALTIARSLSGGWPLLAVLRWLPRGLRDGVYRFVARRRYRWFGRRASCRQPIAASPQMSSAMAKRDRLATAPLANEQYQAARQKENFVVQRLVLTETQWQALEELAGEGISLKQGANAGYWLLQLHSEADAQRWQKALPDSERNTFWPIAQRIDIELELAETPRGDRNE